MKNVGPSILVHGYRIQILQQPRGKTNYGQDF